MARGVTERGKAWQGVSWVVLGEVTEEATLAASDSLALQKLE
jgi:hypothetical protein